MQQHLRLLITEKIQSVAKNLEAQKEAWLKKKCQPAHSANMYF